MSLPELIIHSNRDKVVAIAREVLAGRTGIIQGSNQLASFRHRVGVGDWDGDFIMFVGTDSETDHLPVGEVRRYWAADELAKKDIEIAEAEACYRQPALEACTRLIARLALQSGNL